jgi:ubiquinone/menaquinone biosynthesis C-methylase UbiE
MRKNHEKKTGHWVWVFVGACLLAGTAFGQVDKNRLAREIARDAQANEHHPPGKIMDIISLAPGMSIAEIGAGRGRVVIHLADRVGPNGKVYAEDIDADRLRDLTERCRRIGFTNVEVILGEATNPKLPPGALDLILIVGSYQHFDDPITLMRNARSSLKTGGRVAIVDRFAEKDGQYDVSEKTMLAQMDKAGFVFDRIDKSIDAKGPYIYLFRLRSS